ncbi:MAG: FKBP-type peptidyl-prolyl cis-trans isomerase [Oligosphaeraceae bacterium]
MNFQNDNEKSSYALGLNMGAQLSRFPVDLDLTALTEGIRDMLEGREPQLPQEECMALLEKLFHQLDHSGCHGDCGECHSDCHGGSQDGEKNRAEGEAYRKEFGARPGVETRPSGLQVLVMESGDEARRPKASDVVKVHYTGRLIDGTVFDSSVDRGEPLEFSLNRVIPGWTEGMQCLGVGGKATLVIPPELGYGAAGAGGVIPPQATLVFDVELLDIR